MEFVVVEREGPHGLLLVITDEDIIGKIFEQDNLQLDLQKKFYQGIKRNKQQVLDMIKGAQHLHLTGKASVALGIELDIIDSKKILYVKGVPHAEVVAGG